MTYAYIEKKKEANFSQIKLLLSKYNPINPLLNNSYRVIVIDKVAIIKKILSTDKEKLKKSYYSNESQNQFCSPQDH